MNRLVYTVFVFFWSSVATLLIVHGLADEPAPAATPVSAAPTYTLAQVAKHDRLDDCWMAIRGQVYDFTTYIPEHPTSPRVLAPWCGKDATEGMETKGRGRQHSPNAWSLMDAYRIGNLAGE